MAGSFGYIDNSIEYLFIDGGYLDKVVQYFQKEFWDNERVLIDYQSLQSGYEKVFYYHALPGREREESLDIYENRIKEKEDFFNSLKLLNNFHVYEGVTYGRRGRIRQKAVDVKIAVDMLKHTINGNMNKATLLAGDMDFKPLLESLVAEGMTTKLLYLPKQTSTELLYSADTSNPITVHSIMQWASRDFRSKYSLPRSMQQRRKNEGLTKIRELKFVDSTGFLYEDLNGQFVAESEIKDDYCTITSHADLDFLIKYLKINRNLIE